MLYAMQDDLESRDAIVPLIYPRSLLYFVSGLLEGEEEKPIVGMERFYSGKEPYTGPAIDAVRAYIKSPDPQRVVWSRTTGAPQGFNCTAEHHGGFPLDPKLQDSLVALLRK